MATIRVDPAELLHVAGVMKGAEGALSALEPQIRQRAHSLNWEAGPKADLEEMFSQAAAQAGALATASGLLMQFLLDQAEAYRLADEQSQAQLAKPTERLAAYVRALGPAIWEGAPVGPTTAQAPTPTQLRFLHRVLAVQEEGFGPQTTAALQRLHAEYGLTMPPAGQIDPQAWALVGHHLQRSTGAVEPGAPLIPLQPFVPYHAQTDPAYADVTFGSTDNYGKSGCTLTGIAMLVDYHRGSFEATRESMSELAQSAVNGEGNVVWDQADRYLESQWGLSLNRSELPEGPEALSVAMNEAHRSLAEGEPVIVGILNGKNQHWVVIRGFTGEGAPTDPAQFLIHDPGNNTRRTLADLLNDPTYKGGHLQALVQVEERQ